MKKKVVFGKGRKVEEVVVTLSFDEYFDLRSILNVIWNNPGNFEFMRECFPLTKDIREGLREL